MTSRWLVLAVLTLARTAMGFQFQSVPAVSSQLISDLGMSYAMFGTLIGLYLIPGLFVSLPGGWLGRNFGEKRIALLGLSLMTLGGTLIGLSDNTELIIAGRVLSGTGGVLLNVLVTKMVADWFAGRELVTAMGILIVSWPLGIAVAMVTLPSLADLFSWQMAMNSTAIISAICLILVGVFYAAPPRDSAPSNNRPKTQISRHEITLATIAGLVWTFYNAGLILVLAFGPEYLISAGLTAVAATAMVSIVGWLIMPSLVGGGWLAEKIGRPDLTMLVCLGAVALLVWAIPITGGSLILFVAIGLIFGPPGPLTMALPVEGVRRENRAIGMGVYFTCYYIGMSAVLPLAGFLRDVTNSSAGPLWLSGTFLLLTIAALAVFRVIQKKGPVAQLS